MSDPKIMNDRKFMKPEMTREEIKQEIMECKTAEDLASVQVRHNAMLLFLEQKNLLDDFKKYLAYHLEHGFF